MKAKDYIIIAVIFATIAAVASAITARLIVEPALSSMAAVQEEVKKTGASNGEVLAELRKISEASGAMGADLKEIKGQLPDSKVEAEGSHKCLVFDADAVASCKPGQKVTFLPLRWGNDQLPVFVSQYCDLNYTVVWNNGGVTCIRAQYTDAELQQMEQEKKEAEEKEQVEGQGDDAANGDAKAKQDDSKEGKSK